MQVRASKFPGNFGQIFQNNNFIENLRVAGSVHSHVFFDCQICWQSHIILLGE